MAQKQSVDEIGFSKIFNGEVGHVLEGKKKHTHHNGDKVRLLEDGFEVNGKELGVDEYLFNYDEPSDPEDDDSEPKFKIDVDNLVLKMEGGYRGEGCYWGMYWDEENKRWLAIDFVSDGCVYTLA